MPGPLPGASMPRLRSAALCCCCSGVTSACADTCAQACMICRLRGELQLGTAAGRLGFCRQRQEDGDEGAWVFASLVCIGALMEVGVLYWCSYPMPMAGWWGDIMPAEGCQGRLYDTGFVELQASGFGR